MKYSKICSDHFRKTDFLIQLDFKYKRLEHVNLSLSFGNKNPELYRVAEVMFSISGTQVTVERLFSMLRFILDPLRTYLSDERLIELLILKINLNTLSKL